MGRLAAVRGGEARVDWRWRVGERECTGVLHINILFSCFPLFLKRWGGGQHFTNSLLTLMDLKEPVVSLRAWDEAQ